MAVNRCAVCNMIHLPPCPKPKTDGPAQLVDFIDRVKRLGLRQYKGEFETTHGTKLACEFVFERPEKPRRADDVE